MNDLLILQHEFTDREWEVLKQLADQQELTRSQILRQGLRIYQAIVEGHSKLVEVNPMPKTSPLMGDAHD